MNKQASILLDISFSFSGEVAGKVEYSLPHSYLQRSIYTALTRSLYKREEFELTGRYLASIACQAYFARQITALEQVSQVMLRLPISNEQKAVAHYYQAICIKRRGDIVGARNLLQLSLRGAAPPDRARVLLSLGATYFDNGETDLSLPYYIEAMRAARDYDLITRAEALREIAIIRSIQGDHRQARTELEFLLPYYHRISKYYPTLYYDFLNSLAIELGETGHIIEAGTICNRILATPFAAAHSHWFETRDELAARRTAATPSIIAVPAALETVSSPQAQAEPEPARARSTISLILRRAYSLTRRLTPTKARSTGDAVSIGTVLDRLAYSSLPRSPPALL